MPRFFLDEQVISEVLSDVFPLDLAPDDAKHAKVLRLSSGEHIAVVDASSDYFELEIVEVRDSGLLCKISSRGAHAPAFPKVSVFQGLPKGDKLDAVVRQGTEIGVSEFVPFECSRSVVKLDPKKAEKRTSRLRSIAKSAAMQAGREKIPDVSEICSFDDAVGRLAEHDAAIVFWEESPAEARVHEFLESLGSAIENIAIVVGPEGGFSDGEVERMLAANAQSSPATLGNSILRTETAGVVAAAIVIYELGGLGGPSKGRR